MVFLHILRLKFQTPTTYCNQTKFDIITLFQLQRVLSVIY